MVITVGPTRTAGQTRLDLVTVNAGIIARAVRQPRPGLPGRRSDLGEQPGRRAHPHRDRDVHPAASPDLRLRNRAGRARLRHQLGKLLGVDQDSVHAYVIGEHGDSSFPVWSSVTVGAIRLEQYGLPDGASLPMIHNDLAAAVRERGRSIHERKGFTSYGVAAAVARIVRAIVRDEKRIFMVSVLAAEEYGIGPVALSLPCVVGRGGIARQLILSMSEEERRMLERSASILDQAYRSLSPGRGDDPSAAMPD